MPLAVRAVCGCKVGVHVENSGARAAWRTRVAQMASSRRRARPWLASVGASLCALLATIGINHMQLLTNEVEERPRSVVGGRLHLTGGAPFFLSEWVFQLYLKNC